MPMVVVVEATNVTGTLLILSTMNTQPSHFSMPQIREDAAHWVPSLVAP